MANFEYLFTPIAVGPMVVSNRIMVSTHGVAVPPLTGTDDDAETFIAYYAEKARGGAGWVGGAPTFVSNPWAPGFVGTGVGACRTGTCHAPNYVQRLRRYTDELHRLGAVGTVQLVLQGGMPGAPSTVQTSWTDNEVPHALQRDEIAAIIDDYRLSAQRIRDGGADGIELHANHDDLIQWFLSPLSNRRTDDYGGPFEKRLRFLVEILEACRAGAGRGLALGVRLCADELIEGGYDLDGAKDIVTALAATGNVDYFSLVVGNNWGAPSYIPSGLYPDAAFAYVSAAVRSVTDVPVAFTGLIRDPLVAERLLAEGYADVVGFARAAIADPHFPRKAREGRLDQIRRCVGTNACIDWGLVEALPFSGAEQRGLCSVNPAAGKEREWSSVAPAATRKAIAVVGGGPAGMETARVASERGHRVVLLEREPELGGLLNLAAKTPRQEILLEFVRWQRLQLQELGVEVRLGTEATPDTVLALRPDVVVVATGSRPRRPEIAGSDQPHVVELRDLLRDAAPVGERVVVVAQEDHLQALSGANFLAQRGHQVEFVCQTLAPGPKVGKYTRGIFQQLQAKHVRFTVMTRVKAIDGRTVLTQKVFAPDVEECIADVDTVVLACGGESDTRLHETLKGRGPTLYLIGDAYAPRRMYEATQQAAAVGRLL
jgi:2,4-dienoyl-CoA reductase-like NADH-dependent reductase (Old Yellow Enzyme family)/thioredoxin reductase